MTSSTVKYFNVVTDVKFISMTSFAEKLVDVQLVNVVSNPYVVDEIDGLVPLPIILLEDVGTDAFDLTMSTVADPFVLSGDAAGFAHAAKEADYYTGSEATYAADMKSLFKEFSRTLPDLETEVDTSDTSILKG